MTNDPVIRVKINLANDFHHTRVALVAIRNSRYQFWEPLSAGQVRRAKNTLCGIKGCTCSGELGNRGEQPVNLYALAIDKRTMSGGFTLIETV